jgi:hypothetical protein
VRLWKNVLRPLGMLAIAATVVGAFVHYTRFGRKEAPAEGERRAS